ncbi:YfiR family protein [Sphingosinicella sp. BN140058]|uniref:YfiR family protein n=1 Tax=Sphingosinicella sp. BN140058 TaxID=1892855 RepID=UPI001011B84A|nr:YfiR family protein [Sphingosinicella sp. BN140058]QAY79291.1 YfiR family protein [Sphingosinicella sp. BN140058]
MPAWPSSPARSPELRGLRLAAAALLCALSGAAPAQPSDLAVKAAFLTKFPAYVTWPASAQPGAEAPFALCVIGDDPFGPRLDAAARGQQVDGHAVQVRRLGNAAAASDCRIAFVQAATPAATSAVLDALADKPILTVTDRGAAQGMVHFEIAEGRVRFRIDEAAARKSGLEINSRLLAIALSVKRGP